jgi:hypothetical protein
MLANRGDLEQVHSRGMGAAIEIEASATSATPWTLRRVVTAGVIGNVLEWYDFAVYGFFAPILAAQFFPAEDPRVSLLAAFAAFAVGFLMRPVGAVIFGHIGDRYGRARALLFSIALMAIRIGRLDHRAEEHPVRRPLHGGVPVLPAVL